MGLLTDDANSLQRLLTRLINKKINAATSHIRRIIMSEDTSENPAELFGRDGKIYYRHAGGTEAEIGGAGWEPDGTDIKLATGYTGVNMNDQPLKADGTDDLIFQVETGSSIIFRKV